LLIGRLIAGTLHGMMKMKNLGPVCALLFTLNIAGLAQTRALSFTRSGARTTKAKPTGKLDPKKQFVVDVVSAAVSVPQPDPVDRLRVLAAASTVVMPIRPAMARDFSKEGLRIEQETIQRGETPPMSMLASGPVDCSAVRGLVENVPPTRLAAAEGTLIAAADRCPVVIQTLQRLVTAGLGKRTIAPRLTMALAERAGHRSVWSQEVIEGLYSALPPPSRASSSECQDLAAMYSQFAKDLPQDVAARAGVQLLMWLSRLEPGKRRNLAVNIATSAMMERLGSEAYNRALGEDVGALQVAQTAGESGDIERPEEESASVLRAMQSPDTDRSDELANMPSSLRAREAAASGFAAGTEGNPRLAEHYFDIAFSAVEDVWTVREQQSDAANVVQEVSEAAAQVDAISALHRTQQLQDPGAQAIGMIAVARVVANQ
jgi:hypothetical protein